ncbi:hypothetical protein GCM10010174_49210 [Kutzneria viridogrisea]|uniref:non-ribosomal peptide synthetase n=1 Tax=Kutzneria viridogrisea TaxID=47990 RepID=UPI00296FC989
MNDPCTARKGSADPIAVVGMACRMPGGVSDPDSYWRFLRRGGDGIGPVPPDSSAAGRTFRAGLIDGLDQFDAARFGIAPREAAAMDPRHRLLLEVGWQALEHAGCAPQRLAGHPTGVFVGIAGHGHTTAERSAYDLTGTTPFAAGRLSYQLGLSGPSLAVDTATSSSLVAVHLACQSLRTGESAMALAGGVNTVRSADWFEVLDNARMLSPTGRSRVFDMRADGYVRGEGCGLVVLKRLVDAEAAGDHIWAVIRGSAVNQDGRTVGITAPNPAAQSELIRQALRGCGIRPEQVGYVEAHGTGTPAGDPAELRGLREVFGERDLLVGSVKANIGHLESAAGIAGFLKAVLCLAHGEVPPQPNLAEVTPEAGPMRIPTEVTALPSPAVVGVSSFGASGTNAHVVLEQAGRERYRNSSLLGRRLSSPLDTVQFETELAPADLRLLDEHVVAGVPTASFGLYLATALAAAKELHGSEAVTITDFEALQELRVDPAERLRAQFLVEPDGWFRHCSERDSQWRQHCRGRLETGAQESTVDFKALLTTAGTSGEELYRRLWRRGVYLGASARCIERVWRRGAESVALIKRPETVAQLIDAMFQLAEVQPDRIGHFTFLGLPASSELYCHVKQGSAVLAEPSGRVIAEAHRDRVPPAHNEVRDVVASIVARVLGLEQLAVDEPLGHLGLDSWMAMEACEALRAELGVAPTLEAFLDAQDVVELAARLDTAPKRQPVLAEVDARFEPFPLTDLQQAYLMGRSTAFELGGVNTYSFIEVDVAGLDLDRLNSALSVLIERHDMLRAVISPEGTQRVLPEVPGYTIRATDGPAERVGAEMKARVFDPARWPLFEIRATRLDTRTTRLHIGLDALVVDGWSSALLFREWAQVYHEGREALPELSLTFRDYVTATATRQDPEKALRYWRERVVEMPPAPQLPLAKNPALVGIPEFAHHDARLSTVEWSEFQRLAGTRGVTPSAALCAAYAWVLATWSGRSRFTLNVMFSNRMALHEQVDAVVGNFSTTTLLEVDTLAAPTFAGVAERVQRRLWTDLEHSEVSGVEVLREYNRARGNTVGASMPVVFASMVNFAAREQGGGMTGMVHHLLELGEGGTEVSASVRTPQVWLDHQVIEEAGELVVNWDVVADLFPDNLVETMFRSYVELLRGLAGEPDLWRRTAPNLVPPAELAARQEANATEWPVEPGLLHEPFLRQVAKDPAAIAIAGPDLTYGELDELSDRVAHWLGERARGRLVAVVMDKSPHQVIAVLGTLKAGAAYVPIDAEVPTERLRVLLTESGAAAILTQRHIEQRTEWPSQAPRLSVDGELPEGAVPQTTARPSDLAYVIFTSGSTGTPKGVMIEHAAALNTVLDINERFGIGPADRVLGLSALNFDLSVYDIFGTLAAGAALVLPEPGAHREPARWAELVAEHGVTVWNSVPTLMEMFVAHQPRRVPLRVVMLSGDWIPVTLPARIQAIAPDVSVYSLGGATEAAIWSICYPITETDPDWASVPYGKPLRNQRFHVLDELWRHCPTWVTGELYIAGAGLARGYLGDPDKTGASFVRHPETGERLYRTGDLGRYLPDGTIEFLGRRDFQVKVNGYRVELGEIEAALLRDPRVRAAVVTVLGERHNLRLAGYVVLTTEASPEELAASLRNELPDYLVPKHIMVLPELPLGANGKLDRSALPAVDEEPVELVAPRDEVEQQLTGIWREFFADREFGVSTSFFSLGGNSLLAVRMMSRISTELDRSLPLSVLFGHPTIAALAEVVRDSRVRSREALVPIRETGSLTPLVLVHPVGGDVLCYSALAELLGPDQPVYALQVPDSALSSIPEMAKHYVQTLPGGRCRLGGWSMGGMIALEMATLLDSVERVDLIDIIEPPGARTEPVADERLYAWFARDLAGLSGVDWTPGHCESLRGLYSQARAAKVLPADVDLDTLAAIFERFARNTRALLAYEAPSYGGQVRIHRAGAAPEVAQAWLDRCTGDARVIDLPGDHYSVVREPDVRALAEALR